ncbi:MAG: hypothetical protein R8N23_08015 [Reichenbachiella sp.]|uniref:hypothetical protein n=1 Tax=Reichenbachiella sp. TaxID=2184521 RepID=UPI0029671EAF|nr:hypothetical protein [Reichenbachiella sp.]MDW3209797.1 hypothetical protein [Reichenbachiella sp.]
MKNLILMAFLMLGFDMICVSQNPLPLLKDYTYDTDNNQIDFKQELKNQLANSFCLNAFVRYSKNPFYNQTFSPAKIMLFKANYEYVIQIKVSDLIDSKFSVSLFKDQKITKTKAYVISNDEGGLREKAMKKKFYNTVESDSSVVFDFSKAEYPSNQIVRMYCKTESSDLENLRFFRPHNTKGFVGYVSVNIPEIFRYNLNNDFLEELESEEGSMILKQFSYDVSRLAVSLSVPTTTYKWNADPSFSSIKFDLLSINLPEAIGTSVEEILNQNAVNLRFN